MAIKATVDGSLARLLAERADRLSAAVETTVSAGADQLRDALHAQVVAAGLGTRLANSWRARLWPNHHLDAAATVSTSAPEIIGAFDQGVTIVPAAGGLWLAIPVEAHAGKRATPLQIEQRFGRRLRFVHPPGSATALLVLDPQAKAKGRSQPQAMFILVRQVTLAKRLNIAAALADARRRLPTLFLEQQD